MRIIDIDGHVREADDLWERYLDPPFRARAPKVERVENGQLLFRLEGERHHRKPDESPFRARADGLPANEHRHLAADPRQRLRAMDRDGIARGLLFPSAGLYLPSVEEEEYAAALCRAYNDWLYDYCRTDPIRLMGVGVVPVQNVRMAIDEARRVVRQLGFKGIFVRPNPVKGRRIDDPDYDPLYSAVSDLGVPLLVHEGSGAYLPTAGADRFPGEWFFTHMVSHPFEQMLASLSLICKGTLEKHPELKVVFLESGAGWLPYWLWRMDEHHELLAFQVPWLKRKPSDYFRRQCYVSFEPDEDRLGETVRAIGAERVLFASDYPHWDATFPGVTKRVLERDDLDEDSKRKIMGENAARLLKLD
ncbi:MAG TPA: amidohydrolase family protein [Candidatus Eisenbacteria bacterium]|nr:amidohydrolase family protein [Candidatus Eisenbacteria bacterium]